MERRWTTSPSATYGHRAELEPITDVLDPVLVPLGFAAGQIGASDVAGQVVYCRGMLEGIDDGCVDLVIDVESSPDWKIVDVRYWGFPSDRWHLAFDRTADLRTQVADLAVTLPPQLR